MAWVRRASSFMDSKAGQLCLPRLTMQKRQDKKHGAFGFCHAGLAGLEHSADGAN